MSKRKRRSNSIDEVKMIDDLKTIPFLPLVSTQETDGKIVELYECDYVPPTVSDFVNPHVTVDDDCGRETFIVEIDPNHPVVLHIRDSGQTLKEFLESLGWVNVQHFYTGSY